MTETPKLQVAIVGAGIAGLAAAIALKHHPAVDVQIYERAAELREIGASIALGPNGMRTLDRLGVHNALDDSVAFRNKSKHPMIYRHYKTNEDVSVDNHKGPVEDRHLTSRFYRAHLHQALASHVDPSRLHLSKAFSAAAWDESSQKLAITFADGTTAAADVLLGADGIHSRVRTQYVPSSRTAWTGWTTLRSVFPVSPHLDHLAPGTIPDEAVHVWGPDRTLFLSRLGGGLFTVVGSAQSDPLAPGAPYRDATWNSDGDVGVLRQYYRDWSPAVRAIVDAVPHTRVYPNSTAHALDTWVLGGGRVTLAGDAAHAHGGAFAAGGSLALDDAWAFAAAIFQAIPPDSTRAPSGLDIAGALALYERTRKPHTDRVMTVVAQMNARKVDEVRRGEVITDAELRRRMKEGADTSWIHEHDVTESFRSTSGSASVSQEQQARL
ncbi:salicylate 1-monooxygenase [Pestalotiopsis sp. NC0098]|nr:salicylate 1-monooxygenase [Pestalotiopsis sp. NC0098]